MTLSEIEHKRTACEVIEKINKKRKLEAEDECKIVTAIVHTPVYVNYLSVTVISCFIVLWPCRNRIYCSKCMAIPSMRYTI